MLYLTKLLQVKKLTSGLIFLVLMFPAGQVSAGKYPELNKQELSEVRGKYVSSNQIAYFGITMHTLWKMSNGTHRVGYRMDADMRQGRPRLTFRYGGTLGEQQQDNSALPEPPSALGQVEGAVQAIQISSHHNRVRNNLAIAVSETQDTTVLDSSTGPSLGDSSSSGLTTSTVSSTTPQTQTYVSETTGVTTQFNQAGSLGYTLATEGGVVVQRIGGVGGIGGIGSVAGPGMARQLIQAVQLGQDANTIINDVKLRVEFSQGHNLRNDIRNLNRSLFGLQ